MVSLAPDLRVSLAVVLLTAAPAMGAIDIELPVTERAGVARTAFPISQGVPIPESAGVTDASRLRLYAADGSTPICAQFRVTARWGGGPEDTAKPIMWVLVDAQASMAAGAVFTFRLKDDAGAAPTCPTLTLTEDSSFYYVDTGTVQYRLRKSNWDVLNRVTVNGADLVNGNAAAYLVEGADTYSSASGVVASSSVDESGPMKIVLRWKGDFRTSGGAQAWQYDARMHFFAGTGKVLLRYSILFDRDSHVFIPSTFGLSFPLNLGSSWNFSSQGGTETLSGTDTAWFLQYDWDEWQRAKNGTVGAANSNGTVKGDGACSLFDASRGVTAWNRWTWERYPYECKSNQKTMELQFWPLDGDFAALGAAKRAEDAASGLINAVWPVRPSDGFDLRVQNPTGTVSSTYADSTIFSAQAAGGSMSWEVAFEFTGAVTPDPQSTARGWSRRLRWVNPEAFTSSKVFGNIGPKATSQPTGDLLVQADNLISNTNRLYWGGDTPQFVTFRYLGLLHFGDGIINNSGLNSRFWTYARNNWNAACVLEFVRGADENLYDYCEAVQWHLRDLHFYWLPMNFTDARGFLVNKHPGGITYTHEGGLTHFIQGEAAGQYPDVDDATAGIGWSYLINGDNRSRDVVILRAEDQYGHRTGTYSPAFHLAGGRAVSNLMASVVAYLFTGDPRYAANTASFIDKLKLDSDGSGSSVQGRPVRTLRIIDSGNAQVGWSIFHHGWIDFAIAYYQQIFKDNSVRDLIRTIARSELQAEHTPDAKGYGMWMQAGIHTGARCLDLGDCADDVRSLLAWKTAQFLGTNREYYSNAQPVRFEAAGPWMLAAPYAIKALQDVADYTALSPPKPAQNILLAKNVPLDIYVQEATDGAVTAKFAAWVDWDTNGAAWQSGGNLTVRVYNPQGAEIYSAVHDLSSQNRFSTITTATPALNNEITVQLPADSQTGIYRMSFVVDKDKHSLQLISVSTGKMVAHVQNDTSACSTAHCLSWGMWWFAGPDGSADPEIGVTNFHVLVWPDLRSALFPAAIVAQTANVTGLSRPWAFTWSGHTGNVIAPQQPTRVRNMKPLFTSRPSWLFDVPGIAIPQAALGLPRYVIHNTQAGAQPVAVLDSCPLTAADSSSPYAHTFTAVGGTAPYTWSLLSGSIAGMTLSPAGVLSGTAVQGTYAFTIRATDSLSAHADRACSLTVNTLNGPVIASYASPNSTYGSLYSSGYTATGESPLVWTVNSGSLPPGLSLGGDGSINGVPDEIGNWDATVCVSNPNGSACHAQTYTVAVTPQGGMTLDARPAANGVIVRLRLPGLDANLSSKVVIRPASNPSAVVGEWLVQEGAASRDVALTGLVPGSDYVAHARHGSSTGLVNFSTLAAAGTGTMDLKFAAPAGAATVIVEHGPSQALGVAEPAIACSGSCQVTLTGMPRNELRFFRWSYQNAQAVTIATGNAKVVIR